MCSTAMRYIQIIAFTVLAVLVTGTVCEQQLMQRFVRKPELDMEDIRKFIIKMAKILDDCSLLCAMDITCMAFTYKPYQNQCKLLTRPAERADISWDHWQGHTRTRLYWERANLPQGIRKKMHGNNPIVVIKDNAATYDSLHLLTGMPFTSNASIVAWEVSRQFSSEKGWIVIYRSQDGKVYQMIHRMVIPGSTRVDGYRYIHLASPWSVQSGDVIAIRPERHGKQPVSFVSAPLSNLNVLRDSFRALASLGIKCGNNQWANIVTLNITECTPFYQFFAVRAILK